MQDRLDTSFGNRSGPVITSPYLNFDPSILNPGGSNFIIPEGQGEQRSKMELSFFTMGSAVCLGGFFGGVSGLLLGRKETSNLKGKIRYSQLINFATKRGSISAQSFGAIALMYSLYDTLLFHTRDTDDELNKVAAATLTGITYTAPHGLNRMFKGGLVGLALAACYASYTHSDYLKSKFGSSNSY